MTIHIDSILSNSVTCLPHTKHIEEVEAIGSAPTWTCWAWCTLLQLANFSLSRSSSASRRSRPSRRAPTWTCWAWCTLASSPSSCSSRTAPMRRSAASPSRTPPTRPSRCARVAADVQRASAPPIDAVWHGHFPGDAGRFPVRVVLGDFGWRSNSVLKVLVRFRAGSPNAAMLGTILRSCLNRSLAAPRCRTLQ